MKKVFEHTLIVAASMLLATQLAHAASLDLSAIKLPPDVIATQVATSYIASTGTFTASATLSDSGQWSVAGDPGIAYLISDTGLDSFNLNARISPTGALLSGTISITGILSDSSYNELSTDGPVITGDLTNFGYTSTSNGNPDLEFTFNVGHGDSLNIGSTGGVILTLFGASPNPVSFATNFSDGGDSTADTFAIPSVVPLPDAVLAGAVLLGGLGFARFGRAQRAPI